MEYIYLVYPYLVQRLKTALIKGGRRAKGQGALEFSGFRKENKASALRSALQSNLFLYFIEIMKQKLA